MTDDEAIQMMRSHLEGLFPKVCPGCEFRYASLREYVLATQPLGATISYDADLNDWQPAEPVGTAALSNCRCGTTLALTSDGISLLKMWRLLHWARVETRRRGISREQLLNHARAKLREQVLAERTE